MAVGTIRRPFLFHSFHSSHKQFSVTSTLPHFCSHINNATMRMMIKSVVPRQHFIPESTEGTQALYEGITFERERD